MQIKNRRHILIWIFFGCIMFNFYAQKPERPIYIKAQSSTIPQLLEQISAQTQCYFSYPSQLVNNDKKQIVEEYKGDAATFIKNLFNDTVQIQQFHNQIIIKQTLQKDTTPILPKIAKKITLKGTLTDSQTQSPLPYASVQLKGKMIGCITNEDGVFNLKVPAECLNNEVEFSSLGYYNKTLSIKALQHTSQIEMTSASFSLQEVVIRGVGVSYIMNRCLEQLTERYRQTPYSYEAFYREIAKKSKTYISYNEALTEGFSSSGKKTQDALLIKKARSFESQILTDTVLLKLKGGMNAILSLDIANQRPDFLASDNQKHYSFKINDIKMWHNKMVYIIRFSPKQYDSNATFEGELYISFEDYILMGASFSYTKAYLKDNVQNLILKKTHKTKTIPHNYSYRVEYQELNRQYHLSYARGNINIKTRHKTQLHYTKHQRIFEMTVISIDTTAYNKPSRKKLFKTSSIFSENIVYQSNEFWRYNNLITPERDIMDAFYQSGFIEEKEE